MLKTIEIFTIPILPFGMLNAFLVKSEQGCILIDAGLPKTEAKIQKQLSRLNMRFEDIDLIIITHAHIDHAGNAAALHRLTDAPIVAHIGDLPFYMGEKKMTFCATGWFGRLFLKAGLITRKYERFTPDILLSQDEVLDLESFGFLGRVIPTPGHTEGSISVLMDDQQAFVGDLLSSGILLGGIMLKGRAKRPPFEDNPWRVADELQKIVSDGYEMFYLGHGGPLPAKEVARHVRKLRKIRS